jgi:hypothetical protein
MLARALSLKETVLRYMVSCTGVFSSRFRHHHRDLLTPFSFEIKPRYIAR